MAVIRQGGSRIVADKRFFPVRLAVLLWLGPVFSGAHPAEVARAMGGYVAGRNTNRESAAFHNGAEFHLDGAWHLADSQRGVFHDMSEPYVARRVLGESEAPWGIFRDSAIRASMSRWS